MQNFFYDIPTKVAFGKGQIQKLPSFVKEFGTKVLLVYGGGSIKRSGLYDTVTQLLKEDSINYVELSGVEPNPRITTVERGVDLCREHQVQVVLPIGGGSSIDCAKAIAAAYYYDGKPWDLICDFGQAEKALPIITVLTLAATGSEMDYYAVISNEETQDKFGISSPLVYPKYSIMDPEYTYSVPKYQTAAGTADIMAHIFEVYFCGIKGTFMQDRIMEALLKTCIHYGPIACEHPENYDARANLMWTSSWAINSFIACGKSAAWPIHAMEHQLSAYYDVTHGHGLAILIPVWMEHILNEDTVDIFVNYGVNVFGLDASMDQMDLAREAIAQTQKVFEDMGLTMTLSSIGIKGKDKFEVMAEKAMGDGLENYSVPLTKADIVKIYDKCF